MSATRDDESDVRTESEGNDYTPLSEEVVHEPKCHRVNSPNPERAICTCRPATIRTYPRGITAISRAERPAPVTAGEIAALIRECKRQPAGEYSMYQGRAILEQFNVTRKAEATEPVAAAPLDKAGLLMGAVSRAIGIIDESDTGDEEAVERARAELWAVYDPELDPEADDDSERWADEPQVPATEVREPSDARQEEKR